MYLILNLLLACQDDLMPDSLSNGVVASVLAKQTPQPPENTPREYHNLTAGWVINEVRGVGLSIFQLSRLIIRCSGGRHPRGKAWEGG